MHIATITKWVSVICTALTPPGLPLSGEEIGSPPDKGELEGVWFK
jgi:hypothetical protein